MDRESIFQDLGVNAITAVELMSKLDLSIDEFIDPARFAQFKQVVDYLKQFPEDTRKFIISKVTIGKNADKVKLVAEYIDLLKQRESLSKELSKLDKEKNAIVGSDSMRLFEITQNEEILNQKLNTINQDINIYEK